MLGAVEVTGSLSIVAVIVFVPAVVAVNVAVYVPSLLSVTGPNVPMVVPVPRAKVTVEPPVVKAVPVASRAVSVTVLVPPTAADEGAAATDDCVGSTGPGAGPAVTVTVGAWLVTAWPPIVAVIVLLPAVVAVNVAV